MREIEVVKNSEPFEVNIKANLIGSIVEHHGDLVLGNEGDQAKLEKMTQEFIETKSIEIIKTLQENKVDSLGIGKAIRNSMDYNA